MQKIDLNPFREYLISRIRKGVVNGQKLFWEIKDIGFNGSYETLYRYLRNELNDYWIKPYRKSHFYHQRSAINLSKYKRAIRFETGPGEQAQVDWGHFKTVILNEEKKKLYCIVYDNTKAAILFNKKTADGKRNIGLNLNFFDFARYYGFEIIASPPYWPRNKGKVEAGVKYVRNHFMQGVKFTKSISSLEEFNRQADIWINKVANNRIHDTIKEKPKDRWLKEKTYLKFPNDLPDYQVSPVLVRFSTKDQFIQYKQNFYSVPREYAWRKLFIREINLQGNKLVNIYFQNDLITQHNLCTEKGKSIEDPTHFKQTFKSINRTVKTKYSNRKKAWKNYPEIPVRSFEYYDQLLKN